MFVGDIERGMAGTGIRAGMLKVVTDEPGLTPDVCRVMGAAATAHQQTGVPITTHTHAPSRNGRDQLKFLVARGVAPERVVIGHSGDSEDLDYLRELMDAGATIGMDRFGMEHVLADERRVRTVLELLRLGYADRMVLSHDSAFFSRVTPPSWRAVHAPYWRMDTVPRRIVPQLLAGGATEEDIRQDDGAEPGAAARSRRGPPMTMRTSIATVCLSGTLTEKLHACAEAGFDGVEIFEPDLIARPRPARRRWPRWPAGSASRWTSTNRSATPRV